MHHTGRERQLVMVDIKERVRHREFAWSLGQRIKDARERAGLEQADLATALGASQSAVSRYETGRADVSVWQLACIAEACGAELKKLVPPR